MMIEDLIKKNNGEAKLFMRSSKEIDGNLISKISAFFCGIYNISAYKEMRRIIRNNRPDIVHAHNLYPLLSPSVLVACRHESVPVVLSLHNFFLTCPNRDHFYKGIVCERCYGGQEYWCILKNCRENICESIGYSLRNIIARWFGFYHKNVTLFIALSEFAKKKLIDVDFKSSQIVVLPNMVTKKNLLKNSSRGRYVAFAGRISPEKGVDVLLAAAKLNPEISVRIAGDGPIINSLKKIAPENTKFEGRLAKEEMDVFYRSARFVVVPSKWYEMCPLVISEAMSYGIPVIASKIGGLAEMVDDGVTGLLFKPGDSEDLGYKMKELWENPGICERMGKASLKKANQEYSEGAYYKNLIGIYEKAIEINKSNSSKKDN